ncbi:uncharacterized protein TRIVIDRAFT_70489 [Trichoderma virens Gv29-8]|uniref:Tat pathway signal sequence n=1 Tax=Hypocrea virens (strain Gv29-8 / FGSC 10586) TaxID=413071 RepID=G9MG55_HYPVG|nr:uncharacterized protein TRIVIDRAFT_70489 [Trichoderma virens Gv29-8]EHK26505.1 hypothetical protein TRIVIDRAFT_70489 [Trichoderma virens Gv29-8]
MAFAAAGAQLKGMLKRVRLSQSTTSKLFNQGYKVVDSDGDDEQDKEASLLKACTECPHCNRQLETAVTRRRGGANAYLTYSGWATSIFLTLVLTWLVWYQDHGLKRQCFRELSSHSPLLQEVPDTLTETIRNGSIRWPSPYRGPPSPDVDRAWDRISMFRPLNIHLTDEEYLRIGKNPETAARNSIEYGGGYFLQPEFSHQLHCVNLLRKASHFKYSYYKQHDPDFRDKQETFEVHFDHCVEMLRQFVMCHADVGLVTAHWIEQRARPWPDFNTKQICRDFEGIWQWTVDHQLPEGAPMMPLKPDGAKALTSPP